MLLLPLHQEQRHVVDSQRVTVLSVEISILAEPLAILQRERLICDVGESGEDSTHVVLPAASARTTTDLIQKRIAQMNVAVVN